MNNLKLESALFARICKSILIVLSLSVGGVQAQDRPVRIGLLSSDTSENPFWHSVVEIARAAANDLGIELIVKRGVGNTYSVKRAGNRLLRDNPDLDYLLTGYSLGVTKYHLRKADELGIKVIIFNGDVDPENRKEVGRPRERYENWLGHMLPDDTQTGMKLARELVHRAEKAGGQGRVQVIGLSGNDNNHVAAHRNKGLRDYVESGDRAALNALDSAQWAYSVARNSTRELFDRYPHTSVVWAASDVMALGAIKSLKELGYQPGKEVFVGGFDWSPDGLKAIADGELTASAGGHFMEGAWAVLMAYDHFHGHDFADDAGIRILTPMHIITESNLERYQSLMEGRDWNQIDFRRFTKTHNSALKQYAFDIEQMLASRLTAKTDQPSATTDQP